jgi:Bifunctional DNA primase/polymerase, N-terminal/Primase C terminal 2 (PriCT-2)
VPKPTTKPTPAPSSVLRAALRYARRGLHVFPIKPGTRVPCLSERRTGRRWGASCDPSVVEQIFRQFPRADIGIATGALSGIWVLDVDNKDGKNGSAALTVLQRDHRGRMPRTAMAETPNSGEHFYFRHPGRPVNTTVSKLGPGLDVRGDGGYVVAPPSRGRAWITSVATIAPAPAWLVELVCVARPQSARRAPRTEPQEQRPPPPEMLEMWKQDAGRGLSSDPEDVRAAEDTDLKLWCALRVIPADVDYLTWWRIGCGIYAALGDAGFAHFDEWSAEAPHKYSQTGCAAKWIECAKATAIRPDTVYYLADRHDPGWRDVYKIMLAKELVS